MTHAHDHVRRRSLLAGAGGLLMLAATPGTARATTTGLATGPHRQGAARASRISHGTTLVHADLHNHTLLSDGMGDAELAFESMRTAGLDVAAITDHSTDSPHTGITRHKWKHTGELADAADEPGVYTALRGFEWSHSHLGHVNVWYTDEFTDLRGAASMPKLFEWLTGSDGIGGFNHPGRQPLRFGEFAYDARLADQMVALEMFNNRDDYLFDGWPGHSSPLTACLNAGWRTGLTGVTDEHGGDWGHDEGKGRTGLWVTENTRAGVLAAMRKRRFFASRVSGLRLDATADGVRMGGRLPIAKGDVTFRVDLDRGPEFADEPLCLQVLRPGTRAPEVVEMQHLRAGEVVKVTVPLDVEDGDWVVLRISDPSRDNPSPGPYGHPCNDFGLAYSSPWWLTGGSVPHKSSTPHPSGR
ncbi:CehA/McbA family metallohydrolase [Actinoplanes sp. URMC 104]|uniref:CehA/McbA family metallohydrolase n=1 Tax=Actinoplanes sp. URMC 104 TaxID=3423409 RepID=UPI003F1AC7C8